MQPFPVKSFYSFHKYSTKNNNSQLTRTTFVSCCWRLLHKHKKSFVKAWRLSNSLYCRSPFKVREMRRTREKSPERMLSPFKSRCLPACSWHKRGITECGLGMDVCQKLLLLPFLLYALEGMFSLGYLPPYAFLGGLTRLVMFIYILECAYVDIYINTYMCIYKNIYLYTYIHS